MEFTLKVWRQKSKQAKGNFATYQVKDISPDTSFLEMFDALNNGLIYEGENPVAFDSDCREGICGSCSMFINGRPHGPVKGNATCQLYMRSFKDGESIIVEPWRAKAFPVIKDLVVDRSAFDRIISSGGFISENTGGAQDANNILISESVADEAMDAAVCIGCGACVAVCKNASAMLFVAAKVVHLVLLPQGKIEATQRVKSMVARMDYEGFGACSNTNACSVECPKLISHETIVRLNHEYLVANILK
jgi:succinate dehydrogenase / fumarate reductase iron-sulfur subunit